ncbi:MAG TPA: sugar transferase [Thermoleophilaceae bacterium]|nr:sugar transferase [Thermoleophilaceae bacterium]
MNRALDVLIAGLALALTSPLLAICALAIKLTSPGPVIYRQQRVGLDGEPFDLLKLRTMVVGAEHTGAGLYIEDRDPRITRVGRLLRRFSLDELPNLLNVLRGELAIVGPRPTVQEQVDRYTPHQRRRLEVRPGITGWAQVNGRTSLSWPERIELDVWYVDNRSLALDLRILLKTARLLATGHGLYSTDLKQGWGD